MRCSLQGISLEHISTDKKCTICGEIKPETEFYCVSGKLLAFCKECQKNKEKKRYQTKQAQFEEFKKNLSCKKCQEKRPYLFDFHHRNPNEKDFNISDHTRASFETMIIELQKCDVLCANCHREWHYLNRINPQLKYEDWLNGKMGE